ncbi:MAG: hypothetical protein OIN85_06425 [Candidatus Methanoperedens sp.]|nr:hypothetical protein [Candidatus Methanoperedens sp.]
MAIGTDEILLGVFIIAIAYAAYTTIKQMRTLESSQVRRIIDLMVIGTILYLLDFLLPQERGGQTIIMRTAGMLIFVYGYGILLLEKYREGRMEVKS